MAPDGQPMGRLTPDAARVNLMKPSMESAGTFITPGIPFSRMSGRSRSAIAFLPPYFQSNLSLFIARWRLHA
jgi:hypothetical protein